MSNRISLESVGSGTGTLASHTAVGTAQEVSSETQSEMGLGGRWAVILGLVLPMVLLIGNMVRVQSYTIDDAYISYRYARNFARGNGLVYNVGEYVEGYTNFLWTIWLAVGFWLRLNPDVVAKVLGGLAPCGSLWIVYRLSRRVRSYGMTPCIATWLMATSIVQTGYAVFGMETSFFVFLILAGVDLFFHERDRGRGFPYSGLVFGLAGLTRPEAPMFFGLTILFLGRRLFERQNLLRGLLFVAIVGGHELWRYSYYGAWLPHTVVAKTSTESLRLQLINGAKYLLDYIEHAWVPFT